MPQVISTDDYMDLSMQFETDDEDTVRPDYSGRGMYGATCIAYTGDDVTQFTVMLAIKTVGLTEDEMSASDLIYALDEIGEPSRDGMGLGTVYYWRGIQVEGHERKAKY